MRSMYPLDRPVDVVDRLYWLGRSFGFAVETADGRLGTVRAVRAARGSGRPVSLVVVDPLRGRPPQVVPVSQVAQVNPRRRRILVAARSGDDG